MTDKEQTQRSKVFAKFVVPDFGIHLCPRSNSWMVLYIENKHKGSLMANNNHNLNWIANFIWGIADDVLRDVYVRGKYRNVVLPAVLVIN
jgi:hypothetical protein